MKLSRRSALGLAAATPVLAASTARAAPKRPKLARPDAADGLEQLEQLRHHDHRGAGRARRRGSWPRSCCPSATTSSPSTSSGTSRRRKSYTYNSDPQPAMDAYGRLLPAPNRFPSAASGKGFAPLADTCTRWA